MATKTHKQVVVYLTPKDIAAIKIKASSLGMKVSGYLRMLARKDLSSSDSAQ